MEVSPHSSSTLKGKHLFLVQHYDLNQIHVLVLQNTVGNDFSICFTDQLPTDSYLQPFRAYYTQAERSLHALLQIRSIFIFTFSVHLHYSLFNNKNYGLVICFSFRREWDAFVVSAGHPDGSPVPQSWVLPDAPSDQAWASALHTADTE